MTELTAQADARLFARRALEAAVCITIVALLTYWCFAILRPFVIPVLWGGILAIGLAPVFRRLQATVGGRPKTAAVLFVVIALALLFTPIVFLASSAIEEAQALAAAIRDGTLRVPPPPDSVAGWPMVGEPLAKVWGLAAENLGAALQQAGPHVQGFAAQVVAIAADLGTVVVQTAIAILIAGFFLARPEGPRRAAHAVFTRLAGARGDELLRLAHGTVSSVFQGVLGVALIQAALAGVGLLVAGVPAAWLWSVGVLVVAIMQLPPLLILLPVALWLFSTSTTTTAVLFLIWSMLVSFTDALLKPLLLGRGVDVPMLVILLGAIGGMILHGILGLFVGAVVLALSFQLFRAWLRAGEAVPMAEA